MAFVRNIYDYDLKKFYIDTHTTMRTHRDLVMRRNGIHILHGVGRTKQMSFKGTCDFFLGLELRVYGIVGTDIRHLYELGLRNQRQGYHVTAELFHGRPRVFTTGRSGDNYTLLQIRPRNIRHLIALNPGHLFCFSLRLEERNTFNAYYYDRIISYDYMQEKSIIPFELLKDDSHTIYSMHLSDSNNSHFQNSGLDASYMNMFIQMDPGSFAVYFGKYSGTEPIRIKKEEEFLPSNLGKPEDPDNTDVEIIVQRNLDIFVFSTNYSSDVAVATGSFLSPSGPYVPMFGSNFLVYRILLYT